MTFVKNELVLNYVIFSNVPTRKSFMKIAEVLIRMNFIIFLGIPYACAGSIHLNLGGNARY